MKRFVKTFVVPLLDGKRWRTVCEIGASLGEGTDMLASVPHVQVTVIDPCFDCDLAERYAKNSRVTVRKGTSLEILPKLEGAFDCILIDGDHNWYTVHEELKTIADRRLLRPGGIVFFHDVDWPWGRRDMYYQPEVIPPEYVHDWKLQGIVRGKSEASEEISTLAYLKKAPVEGGPRNGVLTAIEDFLKEHQGHYRFFCVHAGVGLGVMQYRGSFRDRLTFLFLELKGAACNLALWLKRWIKPLPSGSLGEDSPSTGTP
jgi:SAM-dependent methyltransferase